LLLHNDNIIEGTVVRTDGDFAVRDDRGNVRYVATTQVQYRCPTRAEAYRWKRRRIERNDVRGHIRLAQWCLTNDLPHEASDQLLHLSSIAPDHAAIQTIERRLLNFYRDAPGDSQTVLPVVYQQPLKKQQKQRPRELPDAVVAEFKRSVQPVLVNRCGQIACHGSAATSDFQLSIHRNRVLGREMTTRNLYLVTSYLDQPNVEKSSFLKLARTVHGPMRQPAIGSHEFEIYQNLLKWAKTVVSDTAQNSIDGSTQRTTPDESPNVVPTPAQRMLTAHTEGVTELDESSPIILVDPSELEVGSTNDTENFAPDATQPIPAVSDEPSTQSTDESDLLFDPEAFNQRYFPKQ
jgi:hypothetical protein